MSAAVQLAAGVAALGIEVPPPEQERLLAYAALLARWNRVYNLTALRDETSIVSHHLLDSLAVLPHLAGDSVADVGSGGGLPGVVLAICRPRWRVALVESNHKKASFLEQCRIELALPNVSVVNRRVEEWHPDLPFSIVISRALSDLPEFLRLTAHLLAPGGTFAAMKGIYPYEEIAQLPPAMKLIESIQLIVPGVEGQRHLLLIRPE